MDMKEVLSYSLGPVPWSLATAEGAMTKTAKSNLLLLLEGAVSPVEQPPSDAVNIVDGMAMLQAFKGSPGTFGELAEQLLRQVVARLDGTSRIDIVFDCYRDSSIKNFERSRHAAGQARSPHRFEGSNEPPFVREASFFFLVRFTSARLV